MSKLAIVSNRLPPRPDQAGARAQEVGGLVPALLSALEMSGGGLWLGWSGRAAPEHGAPLTWEMNGSRVVGIDLNEREVDLYYNGFCNRAVWPLMHSFQGRVRLSRQEERAYAQVNARFARRLAEYLSGGETVWVHDYHLFLLGRELRRLGHQGRIGFFLHTPFPAHDTWQILPQPEEFLEAMLDYDLAGFHTRTYRDNYVYAAERLIGASWDGSCLSASGRRQRVGIFPIGVDPARFRGPSREMGGGGRRHRSLWEEAGGCQVILGVDRLDYTKGIPNRILAFESLLRSHPQWRGKASLYQICAPSRTRVTEYMEQKRTVDALVGRVNGEYAEHNWVPVRYLYRSYPQARLAQFYREAHVCLVTPLRDGMNLVAKEFVAAQDPEKPGALVLSRFTGASEELRDAILVNPYHPEDVADGIQRALTMSLEERIARHRKLAACVERHSSRWWFESFLAELASTRK
ncbi:MAG: trehalose-6-phosphate synthase [Candidatus Tectomicrobia bacterium]|uniref:Glucosylglycerol-phosphate synthase n=1 Tax=Tectimicrobiota bacterium TaxID=2528274 RepID=A0A932HYH0_UNCTE|nr:trehalose-6-phosphate synthase [Candidatus Tectomicrobia bacterium]